MIQLRDKETGTLLGSISDEQLQFLIDQLEEEYEEDNDYYLNRATLEMFKERGVDPALYELLNNAIGEREEMEIVWTRT